MSGHVDEISAILTGKSKAYDEFESITELLHRALETDQMEAVARFINRRDELIRDIDDLDRRIDRHRNSVPSDQNPVNLRLQERTSREIGEKLKRIMTVDRCCHATAVNRREATRRELMLVRKKREGIEGYALKTKRTPKFLSVQT